MKQRLSNKAYHYHVTRMKDISKSRMRNEANSGSVVFYLLPYYEQGRP